MSRLIYSRIDLWETVLQFAMCNSNLFRITINKKKDLLYDIKTEDLLKRYHPKQLKSYESHPPIILPYTSDSDTVRQLAEHFDTPTPQARIRAV
jgi:hypothetical protein